MGLSGTISRVVWIEGLGRCLLRAALWLIKCPCESEALLAEGGHMVVVIPMIMKFPVE